MVNFMIYPFSLKQIISFLSSARVQGLLRQLVLVPGLDATNRICPSSDPRLAALSVPPLLLDLPIMGREANSHLTSNGNLHFSRHLIQNRICMSIFPLSCLFSCLLTFVSWSCSVRYGGASVSGAGSFVLRIAAGPAVVQSAKEGPLPLRWQSVDHCAGGWELYIDRHEQFFFSAKVENRFKSCLSIFSDHKRLDYVLEHQVLTTSSETHDVEVFIYICCVSTIARILTVLIVRKTKGTRMKNIVLLGSLGLFQNRVSKLGCQWPYKGSWDKSIESHNDYYNGHFVSFEILYNFCPSKNIQRKESLVRGKSLLNCSQLTVMYPHDKGSQAKKKKGWEQLF